MTHDTGREISLGIREYAHESSEYSGCGRDPKSFQDSGIATRNASPEQEPA